ncbi:hypothetical protein EVAR_84417_1 [Eumeta japonica]|uniref:Reverse transcriptase domain-containing protein n=1 Tax=Eumeta variegata TaxID=151549 RepID=A0A4C1W079_EUMVA|nr:hypothetical protein EVAR_84417_1 [Eumeta japonica]
MDELPVKCLLYTEDQVILAPSTCELKEMATLMNDCVKKRGRQISQWKQKNYEDAELEELLAEDSSQIQKDKQSRIV